MFWIIIALFSPFAIHARVSSLAYLRGGTIHGNVTIYPGGTIRADVTPTYVDGAIYLEYEDAADLGRMQDVLKDTGIECDTVIPVRHKHSQELDETMIEPDSDKKCTEPWVKVSVCKTCGKEVSREILAAQGHEYFVFSTTEPTCTAGARQHIRCTRCTAYDATSKEILPVRRRYLRSSTVA